MPRKPYARVWVALCAGALACGLAGSEPAPRAAPAGIEPAEQARTLAALAPPKRARPLIAVLGANAGTETTDFLIPYAVLRQSGVADVLAVATQPGPLTLIPALTVQPQTTTHEFDRSYPEGADYVIVPALRHPDDPAVLAWLAIQRARGATVVGVCSGARVLSQAGLLRDRAATGHWDDIDTLRADNPSLRWIPDRRYVADRGIVTTTGVSASIPVSLALVEAIGGRARAEALAGELGVERWDAAHDSSAFALRRSHIWTALRNWMAFWSHETVALPVAAGVDEIALALTADAYSRTFRSRAFALSVDLAPVPMRHGLALLPDRAAGSDVELTLAPLEAAAPARALDTALAGIALRYGEGTAEFVALQLEYPRGRAESPPRP